MKDQQSFSPGLLYSIAPENFNSLHLHDQDDRDQFDWQANTLLTEGESRATALISFLVALIR